MRTWRTAIVALGVGCSNDGPRITSFAGRALRPDEGTIALDVRVGDRLLVTFETAPPGRTVWVWTLDAPLGWQVDPRTGEGLWEVLPGTPPEVGIPVLVQAGRSGRGPARSYTIHATVSDEPVDTGLPLDESDP